MSEKCMHWYEWVSLFTNILLSISSNHSTGSYFQNFSCIRFKCAFKMATFCFFHISYTTSLVLLLLLLSLLWIFFLFFMPQPLLLPYNFMWIVVFILLLLFSSCFFHLHLSTNQIFNLCVRAFWNFICWMNETQPTK